MATDVVIQHPITDLFVWTGTTVILSPPAEVNFTLFQGFDQNLPLRNVHCTWQTYPATDSWSTYIDTVPFSFGTVDVVPDLTRDVDTSMTISGLCSNMITMNYAVSLDFEILLDDITIVSFEASAPDWWRNETSFALVLESLHSPASYHFDMGNGEQCSLSNPGEVSSSPDCIFNINDDSYVLITLQYTYSEWGEFTVEVTASNSHPLYETTDSASVSVLEWTCDPPYASTSGGCDRWRTASDSEITTGQHRSHVD